MFRTPFKKNSINQALADIRKQINMERNRRWSYGSCETPNRMKYSPKNLSQRNFGIFLGHYQKSFYSNSKLSDASSEVFGGELP